MHVLNLTCRDEQKDVLLAELYARGTAGIVEEESPGGRVMLAAHFERRFPAARFSGYEPHWTRADETNWTRKIMEEWEPLEVGERFFIAPDWRDEPTPAGRLRLDVRPGRALGTGYHATTQMCLEAMEKQLQPGDVFYDLGAGSGILSHAAWLLGERRILASDIDVRATEVAAETIERAGVPAILFTGSTRAVRDGAADILAANISAATLLLLAGEIDRCLSSGGRAILSGFPPARAGEVRLGYEQRGFRYISSDARDDWGCLVMRKG